jgi:hypothetical protein
MIIEPLPASLGSIFHLYGWWRTRTIQFVDAGLGSIYLSPAVFAVSLPPALRMFACALLTFVAFGLYAQREPRVTAGEELAMRIAAYPARRRCPILEAIHMKRVVNR